MICACCRPGRANREFEASIARWIPKITANDLVRATIGLAMVATFFAHEVQWREIRFLQQLELWAYDARLRLFLPREREDRVFIVDIDEKSLIAEGRWPWPRNKTAMLVRELFERYQVAVVGFDVTLSEPDTSSGLPVFDALARGALKDNPQFLSVLEKARPSLDYDRVLAEEIARWPVVLALALGAKQDTAGALPKPMLEAKALGDVSYRYYTAAGYSGNVQIIQDAAAQTGHIYPALDIDGTTRRIPMLMRYKDGFHPSLSLAVMSTYLGAPATLLLDTPRQVGGRLEGWVSAVKIGDLQIPLDEAMTAMVPYRADGAFRFLPATDILRGKVAPGELKDKIVVIGTSAQGLLDLRATPVREDLPGVEIHASLLTGMLDGSIKHRPPETTAVNALMLLLVGLPLALYLPRLSALWATALVAALVGAQLAINLVLWRQLDWVIPIASSLLMVVLLYFVNMVYGFFSEARSRRLITSLFGTYVPKELVDEMSKNPGEYSMQGESREMTVLFSDIRDFTSISEGLTPEGLKDLINTYLTAMTQKVQEQRGTIDKYIGDAIMAFWGAPLPDPQHASHALAAAIAMQRDLRLLDEPFEKRGWPKLYIGVGLNCGLMNVGDMGSAFRRSYTVMGDAVNLASRLEGLTKQYGVGILVSENIVKAAPEYEYKPIDKVQVKGKKLGVAIFEPLGPKGRVDPERAKESARFTGALEAYRTQRWDECEAILRELAHATTEPRLEKLYKLYFERLDHFRANPPPADWDGVFVFTTK
jgi:adenylate cyclase